jgi:RNA polymerase sigma-70 factor (ECF subfamily)
MAAPDQNRPLPPDPTASLPSAQTFPAAPASYDRGLGIRREQRLSVERRADLVGRAQAGDRAAFDQLYEEHVGHVFAVCLRMTADPARAEQITQDAFVRAWQSLHTFQRQSAFSSWLHRLAVNAVFEDQRKTRRREQRITLAEDLERHDASTRPDDFETRYDLERAIRTLPPGARQVLVLHDIEGYPHQDIAELMGVAVGTVKAQLHRARRLLREKLSR